MLLFLLEYVIVILTKNHAIGIINLIIILGCHLNLTYSDASQSGFLNWCGHRPHSLLQKFYYIKCLPNDKIKLLYHKLVCSVVIFQGNHIRYAIDSTTYF